MQIKRLPDSPAADKTSRMNAFARFGRWHKLMEHNKRALPTMDQKAARMDVIDLAIKYTRKIGVSAVNVQANTNLIFTGHQSNWHHCGILAKDVAAHEFANQVAGTAMHVVLDHDSFDTRLKIYKIDDDGFLRFEYIPFAKPSNIALEFRPVPSARAIADLLAAIPGGDDPFCRQVWRSQDIAAVTDSCRNLSDFMTCLHVLLNQALGIKLHYVKVSDIAETDFFRQFLSEIIQNSYDFAFTYNQAIYQKKRSHAKRYTPTLRPLKAGFDAVELPFWVIYPDGTRSHLSVHLDRTKVTFLAESTILTTCSFGNDQIQQAVARLRQHNYRIRPKAVTLSLFCRLCLADLFIHGLGSGHYEYITDHLLSNYYNISGLAYAVATATRFPQACRNQWSGLSGSQFKSKLRQCAFHPEKFIRQLDSRSEKLINRKHRLIDLANDPALSRARKRQIRQKLVKVNQSLLELAGYAHLVNRNDTYAKYRASMQVMNYREFFYGLFTRQEIQDLCGWITNES